MRSSSSSADATASASLSNPLVAPVMQYGAMCTPGSSGA
jgi:hypothetical protein